MGASVISLLKKRHFLPFFLTQFFGAFNDNAYKLTMLTMISYDLTHIQSQSEYYQALASVLFILPFFLFSATSGQLADKYDKAILIRIIKIAEVFLMIIGSFALYYGNIFWMMFTLTGLGTHSTFFGPIKYAILPDHLPKNELLGATGLVDASTFIAILLGTTLGSLVIGSQNEEPYIAIFMTVIVAFLGLLSSFMIPRAPSFFPNLKIDLHFWTATYKLLRQARAHFGIFVAILILSWFWLLGTVILTKLPDYTNYVLGADNKVFALFLALFSIGIAVGSIAVNLIFRGTIALFIIPWAMFGVSCFTADLYWVSVSIKGHATLVDFDNFFSLFFHWRIAIDLFLLAFCSGLFVVPLYTYLEVSSPPEKRARTIATNNIYNALFMVLGTVLVMVLLHFQASIPEVFLVVSLLNAVAAFFAWFYLK